MQPSKGLHNQVVKIVVPYYTAERYLCGVHYTPSLILGGGQGAGVEPKSYRGKKAWYFPIILIP